MPSLPIIPHKHFRAMQGRKLCLAFPPHPLFQLPELISALKPCWDRTGITPRQAGSLGSCKTRTDPPFCPSVSGGWAEVVILCPLTSPPPSKSAREPGWAQGKQKVHPVCSVSTCHGSALRPETLILAAPPLCPCRGPEVWGSRDCCSGQQSKREADPSCPARGPQTGLWELRTGPPLRGTVSWCLT